MSVTRKARGSAFGLTLLAMLVFAALAAGGAQATVTWKVDGAAFGGKSPILGESSAKGEFAIEVPGLGLEISCHEKASGTIEGYNHAKFTSTLTGCSEVSYWGEVCTVVGPISGTLEGTAGSLAVGGEQFEFEMKGEECPFDGTTFRVVETGFSLEFGKEGVQLPVTMSGNGYVILEAGGSEKAKATFSSSAEWNLSPGELVGHPWSFGPTGKPPAETWKIDGKVFLSAASVLGGSYGGDEFTIEVPGLGLEISCHEKVEGMIEAYEDVQFTSTLTECSEVSGWGEVCTVVGPISGTLEGTAGSLAVGGEQFEFEMKGEECPFDGTHFGVVDTDLSLEFGKEGVYLPVTMSGNGYVVWKAGYTEKFKATFSSSAEWHLTGGHAGQKWGLY